MPKIDLQEGEGVEFKREWTDGALEDLAAFANTRGGKLLIGIDDTGEVVAVRADDTEIQRLANLITSRLGITPSIRVIEEQGRRIIEVEAEPVRGLITYRGRYLRRVGSTNRDITPEELARRLLDRSGYTWDALPGPRGIEQVSSEAVAHFARMARERLPHVDPHTPEQLLQNLDLLRDGRLTNGGILLFTPHPQQFFPQAGVRIGIFRGHTEILDTHEYAGTLWDQLDGAMDRFRQILKVRFDIEVTEPSLDGLQRKDVWEYPLQALREAVINTLIHRDYTMPADIQIRLYDDHLDLWNIGELLPPLTPEDLRKPHRSVLRNPLIAQTFYYAGLIERWGTGTTRIIALCREQGLPEPEFQNYQGGVQVTFFKDPYTPERLRALGLTNRQTKIVTALRETKSASVGELGERLQDMSGKTLQRELQALVRLGLVRAVGEKKGRRYELAR